ncbi:MAG: polyhydroxyalkanoate synthesis repressor PhaR [Microvirga sp.]|jgi:polyhydroxyalkanoate synthesis repressor PhaR
MADSVRLIKKYPNRRLYDTQTSSYITLADVKELVLKHEEFQVVDAKSSEDLTRQILLQIILEEESAGAPMFSHDVLTQFIRFYGNAMQGIMGNYLERNVEAFLEIQKSIQDQSRQLYGDPTKATELWSQFLSFQGPAMQNLMAAYMEQSKAMFKQMQDQLHNQSRMFTAFPFAGVGAPGAGAGKDEPKPDDDKSSSKG